MPSAPSASVSPPVRWVGCSVAPVAVSSPQEPKTDQDEEHCRKVNEYLNNPPMPGALGASGSGGHELSALGGNGHLPGCAVRLESVSADVDPGWCGPVAKRRWRIQVRSPLGRFRSWSLLLSSVGDPSVSPIALAPGRRHSAHSSGSAEMGAAPRTLVAAEGWGQTQLEAPGHRSPNLSTFCPAGEGGLQSLLGNMSHSQLMQLIGPAGLGGLGNTPRAWEPLSSRVGSLRLLISSVRAISVCWLPWAGAWFALGIDLAPGGQGLPGPPRRTQFHISGEHSWLRSRA